MKFLIIRFSSIGDIVLTTPVIRCLKKQVPEAEVHFLTRLAFQPILEANPYIDKLHLHHENLDETIETLKKESFDYIIDLHRNIRTLRIKMELDIPFFSFDKLNLRKWLYTGLKVNTLPPLHIVDRYLETLREFKVTNDGEGLDYFIPEKDKVKQKDLPLPHQVAYAAIAIGAAHATKKLPVIKLQELCRGIDFPIVLLGGREDRPDGDLIAATDPEKIYNACGKFNLNESGDLVRNAKLVITHDTGMMHVAAAFKKPTITIWGNTVPEFGMTAYFGQYEVWQKNFEVEGLSCRPCSKIGYKKCPRGHFKCMNEHSPEAISRHAMRLLSKNRVN